ncbi:hypothetical protein Bca4012_009222 [Brassica carinata]
MSTTIALSNDLDSSMDGEWDSKTQFSYLACAAQHVSYFSLGPCKLMHYVHPESRNHLFLDCSFSTIVWSALSSKLVFPASSKRLLGYATIYEIWRERNNRLHIATHRAPILCKRVSN